ncbi:30 kDa heat shock protein [Arthroderma uncinatum]|uniref:30 kDa heat shock protein n=1 Tax=Arthroderma uncinatum TaxID=74035 RepID=UPI00144AC14F|nr:30 kDa heat shock protein [Arthroderma uncinatum]KAF3482093.1 30 kDa heat shock protein [Arthroderma uncinatum]
MALLPSRLRSTEFGPLFRLLDDYDTYRGGEGTVSSTRTFTPRFDVKESNDAYDLDGELPGIDKKNVHLEFTDPQSLTISGKGEKNEQKVEEHEHGSKYWISERSRGEFHRTFSFPAPVDPNAVKASMNHGILSVHVPKTSASAAKTITID